MSRALSAVIVSGLVGTSLDGSARQRAFEPDRARGLQWRGPVEPAHHAASGMKGN
jgi:hypothetical protein